MTGEDQLNWIKPVGLPPLMVVSFGIDPKAVEAFNDFYHNKFLPELFALSPQLRSIRRFEKYSAGNSETDGHAQFLTFYELDREETLENTDAIFTNIEFSKTLALFRQFKDEALNNFSRVNYRPIFRGERDEAGTGLAVETASYRYLTYFELSKEGAQKFLDWYLGQYQPDVFAQAPDLSACHSYIIDTPPSPVPLPPRLLTVYEAPGEETMQRSLEELGLAHFGNEHHIWQAFCSDYTVLNLKVGAFRSIFALP